MTRLTLVLFIITLFSVPAIARPSSPGAETTTTAYDGPLPDVCPTGDQQCIDAKRAQLESIDSWEPSAVKGDESKDLPTLGYMFFKMVLVLGAVCLLAYLSLGKILPRLMKVQTPMAHRKILQVVDRLAIDQRRAIMIIRTGDEAYFLVGVTDQGINLLSRLDSDDLDLAIAAADQEASPKLGKLAQSLLGRSKEG